MQSMQVAVMIKCVEDLNHSNFRVSGEQSETRVNRDNDLLSKCTLGHSNRKFQSPEALLKLLLLLWYSSSR